MFQQLTEYNAMRDVGNFGGAGSNANAETSFSSPNMFKNHVDLSSRRPPSSPRQIASRSETGANAVKEEACSGDASFSEDQTMDENYLSSFPIPSWDDSDLLSDDFLKVTDEKPILNAKAADVKVSSDLYHSEFNRFNLCLNLDHNISCNFGIRTQKVELALLAFYLIT